MPTRPPLPAAMAVRSRRSRSASEGASTVVTGGGGVVATTREIAGGGVVRAVGTVAAVRLGYAALLTGIRSAIPSGWITLRGNRPLVTAAVLVSHATPGGPVRAARTAGDALMVRRP